MNNKKGSGCQPYVMEWCRAGIRREGWRILVYFYVVIFKLKKKKPEKYKIKSKNHP